MRRRETQKKTREREALLAAMQATSLVPSGTIKDEQREEPDFKLVTDSGVVGIEVAELMTPPQLSGDHTPVQVDKFHQAIMEMAEKGYYEHVQNPIPATVNMAYTNRKGNVSASELAKTLAEIGRRNINSANPNGQFVVKRITAGNSSSGNLAGTSQVVAYHIQSARVLIRYEKRLRDWYCRRKQTACRHIGRTCQTAPIWLLLYSGFKYGPVQFSESVDISQPHTFDKVLWHSQLDGRVIEIRSSITKTAV